MRCLSLLTALIVLLLGGVAQACNVPNPNLLAPPFVDGCDVPAVALNRLTGAAFNIVGYGAVPNTNSSFAIQAAINAASAAGGGTVYAPPGGDAYIINAGLNVPAGVVVQGAGGLNWTSPIDNNRTDWTGKSSWFWCQDAVNPCITLNGNGAQVRGLNFWYSQATPSPSSSCASPCTYVPYTETGITPFTIKVNTTAGVGNWINDSNIVNATNCVDWEGPGSGISGVYSGMDHDSFGCLNTGVKFRLVDNTLMLTNLRHELWWYQGTAQWWWIMQDNAHVDWDVGYLANPQINNVEFSFGGTNMLFTDETVTSGFGNITFAAQNMQGNNISFNETCTAMAVAGPSTHLTFNFTNVIAATDSTTSPVSGQCARAQPFFFNLASDNVNGTIFGLNGAFVQSLATLGNGVAGQLHLGGAAISDYSAYAASSVAVQTAANSLVDFMSTPYFFPSTGFSAGALCGGGGCGTFATTIFGEAEITGPSTGDRQVCYTNSKTPPSIGEYKGLQVFCTRVDLNGQFNIDRYSTPGTYTDSPVTISKSSGVVGFPDGFTVNGLTTVAPTGAGAASNYVCTDSAGHLIVQAGAC